MVGNNSIQIKLINADLGYQKSGKSVTILKKVNLNFYAGEFVGVVGLNGVGKSTLLKSLSGILPIIEGQIEIGGLDISKSSLDEVVKKVAIVLTEKFGGFNLTAYDVVCAGMMPYTNAFNQLSNEQKNIVESCIQACGLQTHQYKLMDELSDGFFQRTVIAKALAQQTPIMLLDEPSAFLDYASKHELFLLLKNLVEEQNKCILLSSHDLDLLLKYCHKLLLISDNSIELIDASEALNNTVFKHITKGFL